MLGVHKTLLALPSVAGTLTRGLARFARILAHVLAPQSLVLYDKGTFVFPIFFLISFLLGNFIGFRIVLRLLKVNENVNKRSMLLTGLFLITQAFSASIVYLADLVEPASVVISILLFSFILKRFMVLKLWQVILIPIGVSLLSGFILAILLISTVQLWGGARA